MADKTNDELQKIAMQTHLEVLQREDLRRDLAINLRFVDGPLLPGDRVYYWQEDPSKIVRGLKSGKWIKARVIAVDGPICSIDIGTQLIRVNISKLRKEPDCTDWDSYVTRERAADSVEAPSSDVFW